MTCSSVMLFTRPGKHLNLVQAIILPFKEVSRQLAAFQVVHIYDGTVGGALVVILLRGGSIWKQEEKWLPLEKLAGIPVGGAKVLPLS